MKKIIIYSVLAFSTLTGFAAVESISCGSVWSGTTSCEACFYETQKLYTCNPYQTSCQKQVANGMNDIATNISGSDKVMYQFDMGSYTKERLQSTTSWTMSHPTLGEMFEVPQAYLQPASAAGQKWYQYFSSSTRYWHLLPVGTSVLWTQMKNWAWLRPDLASEGTNRNLPAYRMIFTPRLYTDKDNYIDHKQCVFYYVRFCGDGTIDTDKGEVCDDGNMNNGDGCNNVCQPETVNLTCDNLTISPATLSQSGGSLTATCDGTNETQYKFILKQGATVVNTIAYQNSNQATFSIPANTGTSGKPYSVECQVKNANESDKTSAACMKALTVPGTEPICLNLNVTPTSVTSGGDITYSCSANNATSYSVVVKNPDNSTFQSFTSATGSFTVPANPAGSYSVACYINGQTSTPSACQKTVTNTIPESPLCTNLSVTKNGTSVDYSCTGSGPITSYTIQKNGTTVSNNASGSIYLGYGTHTLKCFVNNTITANACEKTVTIDRPNEPEPRIEVIKDDDDNHDDRQNLEIGDDARFSILVRNNGSEGLENLTLDDPRAPECNRSSSETRSYIQNVGNRDEIFDPGESFTYTCRRNNVIKSTFPSDENNVCVYGRGRESRRNVEDCDKTRIYFDEEKICEFMRVNYDRVTEDLSQVQVSCSPTDGYRLGIVKNGRLMDRLTSPIGEFDFELEPGNYSLTCLRDGEDRVRSDCTKKITIQEEEQVGECRLRSSARFGGAPLRTRLTCETPDNNDCRIGITRNGRVWDTIDNCDATLTFDQPGQYEAVCILDGNAEERCSTSVVVDTMTKTPTGPGAPLAMLALALSGTGYLFYRRRKAA